MAFLQEVPARLPRSLECQFSQHSPKSKAYVRFGVIHVLTGAGNDQPLSALLR